MIYKISGKTVTKEEFSKGPNKIKDILESGVMHTASTGWPMHSDALGVNPSQVKEAYEESVRMGVPTQFNSKGQAILESRGHRKAYAEANGMYDRDGGCGDPQPKNVTSKKVKAKKGIMP